MSRSNPNDNAPSPVTRWFEWNGEKGLFYYKDKDAEKRVEIGTKFSFVLLDQLGCVRGWHDRSDSGIHSNQVRDTRQEVFVVRCKDGIIGQGLWKNIKAECNALGGNFNALLYIGYKDDDGMKLGALTLKGAALKSWMEFTKHNRADIYKKAIVVDDFSEGQKGRVTFRSPIFKTVALVEKTQAAAVALDTDLQAYLASYLKNNQREQAQLPTHGGHVRDEDMPTTRRPSASAQYNAADEIDADDIPF